MTWQKVVAAKTSKEAQFAVAEDAPAPEEMGIEPATDQQAADVRLEGCWLTLESKDGGTYEFGSHERQPADQVEMAPDIVEALEDGKDVWAEVNFDGGYVEYWADGAPWDGGDVKDNYGLLEGY